MTHYPSDNPHASVSRYPCEWPSGWTRTLPARRIFGRFKANKVDVTVYKATTRLERQLEQLGAADPVLSTNVSLKLNGQPRSDERPADPAVACYFRFKGKAVVFACDRYRDVADNIAAIAAHVDALRRIDRYGVGSIEQALGGYRALPVDSASAWRQVFGFGVTEPVTVEELDRRWKVQAQTAHPDKGGTDESMMHLNRAKDYALAELVG